MASLTRSILLPYRAASVYQVVADIEQYSEFLPWCIESTILESSPSLIVASLSFRIRGITHVLVTRNTLEQDRRMLLEMVSGPVRHFEGEWIFSDLGDGRGCSAEFNAYYELSGFTFFLQNKLSKQVARKVVEAFLERCTNVL